MKNHQGLPKSDLEAYDSTDMEAAAAEVIVLQAAKVAQAVLAAEVIVSQSLAIAALAGLAKHEASPSELRETADETLRVARNAATEALGLAKTEAHKVLGFSACQATCKRKGRHETPDLERA